MQNQATQKKVPLTGLQIFVKLLDCESKKVHARGSPRQLEHLKDRLASLGIKAETNPRTLCLEVDMSSTSDQNFFKGTHIIASDEFAALEIGINEIPH